VQGNGLQYSPKNQLATVTTTARRGAAKLYVSDNSKFVLGARVQLVLRETAAGDLQKLFLGGSLGGPGIKPSMYAGQPLFSFASKVAAVGNDGKPWVRLVRTIPLAISTLALTPTFYSYLPTVAEVGIELLTIEFPWSAWPGEGKEIGNNAILVNGASQFFIHQVNFTNVDVAVMVNNSRAGTITGNVISTTKPRSATYDGTTGFRFSQSTTDMLAIHFNFSSNIKRDIVIDSFSGLNAVTGGSSPNMALDLHSSAPWANLFSLLTVGVGSEALNWDGPVAQNGPASGAWNTFYNLFSANQLSLNKSIADNLQGVSNLIIDCRVDANTLRVAKLNNWILDGVPFPAGKVLSPSNIYAAEVYSRDHRSQALTA
jgi:hypothetical protein